MSTTRRAAIRGASIASLLGVPAIAAARPKANPDSELILVCRRFAEGEFELWYRYIVLPELADDDWPERSFATYNRIVATPATTPEGWHAKALAYVAWDREAYDDNLDDRCSSTTFLSALLRDMVRPARNAIIARLAAQYGPLPSPYTKEGIWIGYTEEELTAIRAEHPTPPPRDPEPPPKQRALSEMTQGELERLVAAVDKIQENLSEQRRDVVAVMDRKQFALLS